MESEYLAWLATLTPEQRAAVEQAVGIVMNALLMLETRMAKSEAEMIVMNKRLDAIERYLCFPEKSITC